MFWTEKGSATVLSESGASSGPINPSATIPMALGDFKTVKHVLLQHQWPPLVSEAGFMG
jgi:hypothetical protein